MMSQTPSAPGAWAALGLALAIAAETNLDLSLPPAKRLALAQALARTLQAELSRAQQHTLDTHPEIQRALDARRAELLAPNSVSHPLYSGCVTRLDHSQERSDRKCSPGFGQDSSLWNNHGNHSVTVSSVVRAWRTTV